MSTDDTLRIEADDIIVERFPERAAGELAAFFLDTWEPGTPIEINLRELPTRLLISSFFATFMERLHKKDPKLCRAAINDITWITQHEFQRKNIQSWMEPWKGVATMNEHTISNTGRDEEGREIGDCSCGATGVDVDEHLRTVAIQSVSRSRVEPSNLFPQLGKTVAMPVEYTNVKKLRELYPSMPHDLARYDGNIVEVISYPSPPTVEDIEEWARLGGSDNAYKPVFPQATVLVRLTPGEPTTVKEVHCFQVESVPHEDDDGRVSANLISFSGANMKMFPMPSTSVAVRIVADLIPPISWWAFYRLDATTLESPQVLEDTMIEFLADPKKCDKILSEEYEEYGPPKL